MDRDKLLEEIKQTHNIQNLDESQLIVFEVSKDTKMEHIESMSEYIERILTGTKARCVFMREGNIEDIHQFKFEEADK